MFSFTQIKALTNGMSKDVFNIGYYNSNLTSVLFLSHDTVSKFINDFLSDGFDGLVSDSRSPNLSGSVNFRNGGINYPDIVKSECRRKPINDR